MEKPPLIRTCVNPKSANTSFKWSLTSSIDSNTFFSRSPTSPMRQDLQKATQITGNLGPIRTCVDSKLTSTGSEMQPVGFF